MACQQSLLDAPGRGQPASQQSLLDAPGRGQLASHTTAAAGAECSSCQDRLAACQRPCGCPSQRQGCQQAYTRSEAGSGQAVRRRQLHTNGHRPVLAVAGQLLAAAHRPAGTERGRPGDSENCTDRDAAGGPAGGPAASKQHRQPAAAARAKAAAMQRQHTRDAAHGVRRCAQSQRPGHRAADGRRAARNQGRSRGARRRQPDAAAVGVQQAAAKATQAGASGRARCKCWCSSTPGT